MIEITFFTDTLSLLMRIIKQTNKKNIPSLIKVAIALVACDATREVDTMMLMGDHASAQDCYIQTMSTFTAS